MLLTTVAAVLLLAPAYAQDKSITLRLPKHSKPTPVQKLNRDGVKAIAKHQYDRAKKLFYEAYLLDPNDPFTLNNLGYISELEGRFGQAQRYYSLASAQKSDAVVDASNSAAALGKPVSKVAGNTAETGMQINQLNVAAIELLQKGRAPEADLVLHKALALDPRNPFTLNNLGFAKEKEGELETALSYYTAAASLRSDEHIMVTMNRDWRGKPISQIAGENAKKLRKQLRNGEKPEERVQRLNLEGVSAMNRNDRSAARRFFQEAYNIDPHDAFTLNNMGYLAEMDGDKETADFYYDKAREAKRSSARIDVATRRDVEGKKIGPVAEETDQKVQQRIQAAREERMRQGGPIELKRRDKTAPPQNVPPAAPPSPPPAE